MQCLYCGKDRPLLKRLTGGGEFCSEAHKERYHEEYNRLALSRLLQAQAKPVARAQSPAEPVPEAECAVAVAEEEASPGVAEFRLGKPEMQGGEGARCALRPALILVWEAAPRFPALSCAIAAQEPVAAESPGPPPVGPLAIAVIPCPPKAGAAAYCLPPLDFAAGPLYRDSLGLRLPVTGIEITEIAVEPAPPAETAQEDGPPAVLQLAPMLVEPIAPAKPRASSALPPLPMMALRPKLFSSTYRPLHPRIVAGVAPAAAPPTEKRKSVPTPKSEKSPGKMAGRLPAPPAVEARPPSQPQPSAPATLPPSARPQPRPVFDAPNLGPMASQNVSVWAAMSPRVKTLAGILILAVLVGVGYLTFGFGAHTSSASVSAAPAETAGSSIMMGEGGWSTDWGGEGAGSRTGRQITIYRPSLQLADYRLEFQAQIENRSVGWVFRAKDPKNYYAMKIEAAGAPGKVALVRYIVVDGKEQQRSETPLPPGTRDAVYSVRLDVRGPKFSTTVQGQPVNVWTDQRLKAGGVGFFSERGERARVKSVQISMLGAER